MKIPALLLIGSLCCAAETRTLTLQQALQLALQQNPDLVIARLDEQKAGEQVKINKSPFSPSVYAGSGLAWAYGFPSSIDGSAPSIVQARTTMSIYDKPQSYLVEEAKEQQRGAGFGVDQKRDEIIFRVASAYIDAENAAQALDAAKEQDAELARVKQLVQARVDAGEELAHEAKKASVAELDARHQVTKQETDLAKAERALAGVLGLTPGDRVHAAEKQMPVFAPPISQEAAVAAALSSSSELKKLNSDLQAKALEAKSYQAYKRPKIELVAQYSLLSKFDNYTQYFQRFQYNNAELGASFSIPLLVPRSAKAYLASSEIDAAKIRNQILLVRARIQSDIENAFDDFRVAEEGRQVALEYLNVTRDSTTLDLSRVSEGQVLQSQVEQDRADEQEKWRAYYDALAVAQHARLNLLRTTGTLQEALK
jgi:outer membrane protein